MLEFLTASGRLRILVIWALEALLQLSSKDTAKH